VTGRRRVARRSSREWAVRGVLAVVLAATGYLAISFSVAQVAARISPEFAYRLAPYDGRIAARIAAMITDGEADPTERVRADVLAREALRLDPTAVAALSTLGIDADVRGDRQSARRLFDQANRLSRRDLKTQLWKIEDAVGRGDVPGALRAYDIALRTHPYLSELLFPVLGGASADPTIRQQVVRTLATRPAWGADFVNFVAAGAVNPDVTASLLTDLARARVPVPPTARRDAIDALVKAGRLDAAWRYYASTHRGADRRRGRDPRFAAQTDTPSVLDWLPVNADGIVATTGDGGLNFSAPASLGGAVIAQAQLLPPGRYQIAGRASGIADNAAAEPYWVLQCRNDARELGRAVLRAGNGPFAAEVTVPTDCPIQTLALIVRPSDAIGGTTGRVEEVVLTPVHMGSDGR
jgi:uncharacterized tellurite resistance protein B-like protein